MCDAAAGLAGGFAGWCGGVQREDGGFGNFGRHLGVSRRGALLGLAALGLAGCGHTGAQVVSGDHPAAAGRAFMVMDVEQPLGGLFGNTPADTGVTFVNVTAAPNLLWAWTPEDMKLFASYR